MITKLFEVFEKITTVQDTGVESIATRSLGFTHAVSEAKAISNVKHKRGIHHRNHYVEDNYSFLMVHDIYAKEKIEKNTILVAECENICDFCLKSNACQDRKDYSPIIGCKEYDPMFVMPLI